MAIHNVAIVGLGRVGSAFLKRTLRRTDVVVVKAVCELYDTDGRKLAIEENLPVLDMNAIVGLGVSLDVIFDLTGDDNVTRAFRKKLEKAGNTYTQVAQDRLTRLVWSLMGGEEEFPNRE